MAERKQKWKFFLIIVSGAMVYLWITLQVISSGINHKKLQEQRTMVLNKNKDLKIEYSDITSASNVEKYGMQNLGLTQPSEKQFRYIK